MCAHIASGDSEANLRGGDDQPEPLANVVDAVSGEQDVVEDLVLAGAGNVIRSHERHDARQLHALAATVTM